MLGKNMEAIESLDKECSALGGLYQQVINDMKAGVPQYEDFVNKAYKLHTHLKGTLMVLSSFLDSFQKIADAATNTKGKIKKSVKNLGLKFSIRYARCASSLVVIGENFPPS